MEPRICPKEPYEEPESNFAPKPVLWLKSPKFGLCNLMMCTSQNWCELAFGFSFWLSVLSFYYRNVMFLPCPSLFRFVFFISRFKLHVVFFNKRLRRVFHREGPWLRTKAHHVHLSDLWNLQISICKDSLQGSGEPTCLKRWSWTCWTAWCMSRDEPLRVWQRFYPRNLL